MCKQQCSACGTRLNNPDSNQCFNCSQVLAKSKILRTLTLMTKRDFETGRKISWQSEVIKHSMSIDR